MTGMALPMAGPAQAGLLDGGLGSALGQTSQAVAPKSSRPATVVMTLAMRHRDRLDDLIAAQRSPGSPAYEQPLSAAAFDANYAPSAADVARVTDYLRENGFTRITTSSDRMLVTAEGTDGIIAKTLGSAVGGLVSGVSSALTGVTGRQLPGPLQGLVSSIQQPGARDGFHVMARAANRRLGAEPASTAFSPLDFPRAYGVSRAPDGRGTSVGIITAGELSAVFDDYETAQEDFPLPRIPMEVVRRGDEVDDEIGVAQWDIDSQVIQAAAGGYLANMIFYNAPTLSNADITTAVSDAVNDGRAKILNISLGQCESAARASGTIDGLEPILAAGAARGMVFSVAAGQTDRLDCPGQQSYPASSPYVVAVGATSLTVNSAGGYRSERVWSPTRGGPSTEIARPGYQADVVPDDGRGVPDLVLNGDPATGAVIIFDDDPAQYGGTGLSAALFTGFYARLESATNNTHGQPALYDAVPERPSLARDITAGGNARYDAVPGWDYASGFGSPVIDALVDYAKAHPDF